MNEFAIQKRCEEHTSWYCDCQVFTKVGKPVPAVVKFIPPPPTPKIHWPAVVVLILVVQFTMGGFALVASKFGEDAARSQLEIKKLQEEIEKNDRKDRERLMMLLMEAERRPAK